MRWLNRPGMMGDVELVPVVCFFFQLHHHSTEIQTQQTARQWHVAVFESKSTLKSRFKRNFKFFYLFSWEISFDKSIISVNVSQN